ncbi:MAG TPA: poly-gamma-glutamate synthase PgsB, partial [Candidatus Cloacimonadota bacterium]|nr:poly-gamma-glutamate synthase PgsB [Candidatus Cloacimonadota bacterium]
MFRSKQLIDMLANSEFTQLYLVGQQTNSVYAYGLKHKIPAKKMVDCGWVTGDELMKSVQKLPDEEVLLIGIG